MRTILLPAAVTPFVLALAIAVFLAVLRTAFRVEAAALLEEDLPFAVRLDLSLLAPALLLLFFALRFIVVLLAPIVVASSYVPSLTLTLLILPQLNFVLKFFPILFQFHPYLMYNQ